MAIKVKQSTIDEIKKMGMTKALASAKTRRSPEFQEALKRMYGQRRLDAAMKGAQGGSMSRATYMYKGTSPSAATATRKKMIGRDTPGAPAGTSARQVSSKSQSQIRNRAIAVGSAYVGGGAAYAAKKLMDQRKKNSTKQITSGKPKTAITAGRTPMSSPKSSAGLTPSRASAMASATMQAKERARKAELAKRGAGSKRPKGASKGTQTTQQKAVNTAKKVGRLAKSSTKQTLKPSKAGGKVLGPVGIGIMVKEQAKAAPKLVKKIAKKKAKGN